MRFAAFLGLLSLMVFTSWHIAPTTGNADSTTETLKWYTWEEAVEANKLKQKKIFVDVYTNWCGWCKKMDSSTFKDPKVVKYLNDNFYPVKLNAEMKEEVVFQNHTFKYMANQGRRGVHTLAYSLLDGRMSYPSYVFLNENFQRILIAPGYQPAKDFMYVLTYTNEGHYNNTSWQDYLANQKK